MSTKKQLLAIISLVSLLLTGNYVKAADPVGHWEFDEASGTTAYDSSTGGQNGTVYGGAALDGSGSLTLAGDNDYVSLPIGSLINSLNSCTIAAWVDFSGSGGNWQRIFDFGTTTSVNMFLTPSNGDGQLRFGITTSGAGGEQQLTAGSALQSGPHLVVVRINAAANTGTLFLDGTPVDTNTSMTLAPSDLGSTTNNWLGRSQYSDPYFNGALDEFRIYNTALSDTEIASFGTGTVVNTITIEDSFDASHNYLTDGVEGTIWDGFIGLGAGETVNQLNASQTTSGVLYVSSTNGRWEPIWDPLGPFLYINVEGDFIATVRVVGASSTNWNTAGLAVRIPNPTKDGSNENFETMEYFQAIGQHMARSVINGVESEFAQASPLAPYLRLRKVDNLIYHEYSNNGTDWNLMNGSPKIRDDMEDVALQVGIQHATYISTEGYFEFDDFTLETEGPYYEAQLVSPADGQEGVMNPLLDWIPGVEAAETGGHDLYIGLNENDVQNATRSTHPNVDYYNLDLSSFDASPLLPGETYYWRVDEVNLPSIWPCEEVWSFTMQGVKAAVPSPTDGATDVELLPLLGWQNGLGADRHDIYFGTDYNLVLNADKYAANIDFDWDVDIDDLVIMAGQWLDGPCLASPCADAYFDGIVNLSDFSLLSQDWQKLESDVYRGTQDAVVNTYSTELLLPSQTYYWRVDEFDYDGNGPARGDVWSFTTPSSGPFDFSNEYFDLTFNFSDGGFTKIQRTDDSFETNFLGTTSWHLGDIETTYRINSGSWENANTYDSDDNRNMEISSTGNVVTIDITYPTPSANPEGIADFDVSQQWVLDGNHLTLNVQIENTTGGTLELGDVAVPLPFNSNYDGLDTDTIQTKRVLRHGFFSGHASHSYWTRVNGQPDFLVMNTPSPDTRFEYWDFPSGNDENFKAYVYSGVDGPARSGNWRQAHTTKVLAPGESINLAFDFSWADSLSQAREQIYENGDIDIECVPGMTIPQDLHVLVKLKTKQTIDSLVAEYPADTTIQYMGEPQPDTHIYKISFQRLGENIITVNHNSTEQTILEFFSTEPLETLYKKRSTHMANHEQVSNPSVWYDGLFGEWDMRNSVLRTPDDNDGMESSWWMYVITCDDPGNAHAPFLAGKNVRFPVQAEIDACEYYIENYLWGGMQYTESEYSPYGILGVVTWEINRASDPDHIWRVFDYPHIVMLYYHMYEIAKYYPDMVSYLDADGYLYRAYRTALKYFELGNWGYTVGTYNEVVNLDLIKALRERGWNTEADSLQAEWDEKVKYFIFDKEYPYGSEYAMDSTAFESTHALVKWAKENGLDPDPQHPVIDPARIETFMHDQMAANLAVRGCIEPAFYTYGSDYRVWGQTRYTLSYMSQMGGWAVLDYALNYTDDPIDYIRLGYGSYLSSWALMNTDPTGSNGYWYPDAANDGAIGWAFKPEKNGPIWLQGRNLDRGIWYYNGEIDLGLCGALRMAMSVVSDDPIFGLFGYGCDVNLNGGNYEVVLKDGLREWLVMHNLDVEVKLNRDAFAAGQPVSISQNKDAVSFTLDNEWPTAHTTTLNVSGLDVGTYSVQVGGVNQGTLLISNPAETTQIDLTIGTSASYTVSVTKQ